MESTLTLPSRRPAAQPRSAGSVLALLERIEHGSLEVRLPDGSQQRFGQAGQHDAATLEVADWSVFDSVLERGDVGFAEPGSTATGTARISPRC
jgi:cyclopropane-fatty-acyl-phospholipid synthase